MRTRRSRLSRRELALVAAALLVPLPVFAMTGLSAPLPNAIERGLGGLVTVEAEDEQSGTRAVLDASGKGGNTARSADASLAVARSRSSLARNLRPTTAPPAAGGSSHSTDQTTTGGDTSTNEQGSADGNGGNDSGSPDGPGGPESSEDAASGGGDSSDAATPPSVKLDATGEGAGAAVVIDRGGVDLAGGADGAAAGDDEGGAAGASVTRSDGSSTGVSIPIPGASLP